MVETTEELASEEKSPLNFVSDIGTLKSVMTKVLPVVSKQAQSTPVLSHVLLQAIKAKPDRDERSIEAKDHVTIMATDSVRSIKCAIAVEQVREEGFAAVPGKLLYDFLGKDVAGTQIEVGGCAGRGGLTLNVQNSYTAELQGMESSHFPSMPIAESAIEIKTGRQELWNILQTVKFAASKTDYSQNEVSVRMEIEGGEVACFANDGRVYASAVFYPQVDASAHVQATIPLKGVEEMCRLLGKPKREAKKKEGEGEEEEVRVEVQGDRVALHISDSCTFTTQLLAGHYYSPRAMAKQQPKVVVRVDREEMLGHLKKVGLFVQKDSVTGSVALSVEKETMRFETKGCNSGRYEGSMALAEHVQDVDESFCVGFNPTVLAEVISHVSQGDVTLGLNKGCAIIKDNNFTFVLATTKS